MTRLEFALILNIIDKHSTKYTYNYGKPDSYKIENVIKLKEDLMNHYEAVLSDNNYEIRSVGKNTDAF